MAVEISGRYLGNKKMSVKHEPSGVTMTTSAPVDIQGDGSSFSPTDLLATSLGACMTTTMAVYAERNDIDLTGMSFRIEKHMGDGPRRIVRLPLEIHLPAKLTVEQRQILERVGRTCPVHHSLDKAIEANPVFYYDV